MPERRWVRRRVVGVGLTVAAVLIGVASCTVQSPTTAATTAGEAEAAPSGAASLSTGPAPSASAPASSSAPSSSPSSAPAPPVPHGYRAVDALGLEITTPVALEVDPVCAGRSVSRPAYGLTYAVGCIPLEPPAVWILSARDFVDGAVPPRSLKQCAGHPVLDGEPGCALVEHNPPDSDPWTTMSAVWPAHDVAVEITTTDADLDLARRIIASARWVPVDRNGCAAQRSPVVDAIGGAVPDGPVLPADTASLGVCWYSEGRLVASALVGSDQGSTVLMHPTTVGPAPGIGVAPPYRPNPRGPSCAEVDRTEGVVFLARGPAQLVEVSTAQFADCTGGQRWSDGAASQSVDEALASALRPLTGFLLTFGYRAPGYDYPDIPTTDQPTGSPVPTTPIETAPSETAPSSPPGPTS